jgi:hypothetical protein
MKLEMYEIRDIFFQFNDRKYSVGKEDILQIDDWIIYSFKKNIIQ